MEEAVEKARRIVETYDAYCNGGISEGNAERQYLEARRCAPSVARALLSSSAAERGMREALEKADEHIGALLRIYEDAPINSDTDRARAKEIATAFGERCLAAALSVEEGKEQARSPSALSASTDRLQSKE